MNTNYITTRLEARTFILHLGGGLDCGDYLPERRGEGKRRMSADII
ncbi:MAG: hypothetical protein AAGC64_07570 [Bacteroidota bacterium]